MSERGLSVASLVLVVIVSLGVLFPREAESVVMRVFPAGERPEIDDQGDPAVSADPLAKYLNLLSLNKRLCNNAFTTIEREWQPTDAAMLLATMELMPTQERRDRAFALLRSKTGQSPPDKMDAWYAWLWDSRPAIDPRLRLLMGRLYERHASEFKDYFDDDVPPQIPLDELRTSRLLPAGVRTLSKPAWIPASEADYLAADDVVYTIDVQGEFRTLPQKVVSRFHVVRDSVGGVPYVAVYDKSRETLDCLQTTVAGKVQQMTDSGFLQRRVPLLRDLSTNSLWSIETGRPVVGPLAASGQQLERIAVTRSVWSDWRREHPDGKVLADAMPAAADDD